MTRTLITLDEQAKAWLAQQAKYEQVSMSEIVRRAIDRLRADEARKKGLEQSIAGTAGIWPHGDGLVWQSHLHDEWGDA